MEDRFKLPTCEDGETAAPVLHEHEEGSVKHLHADKNLSWHGPLHTQHRRHHLKVHRSSSHQSRTSHQINLLVLQIFSSSTSNGLKFFIQCPVGRLCTLDLLTRVSPAQPASTSLSWKGICPFAKTRPLISNTELSTTSVSSIPLGNSVKIWGAGGGAVDNMREK